MVFRFSAHASDIALKQMLLMLRGMPSLCSAIINRAPAVNKGRSLVPRNTEPMIDVGVDFLGQEWLDPNHQGNPLAELCQRGTGQPLRKLRLSCYNDLHQFHPRRLEIREKPHGFEDLFFQVLRLINHQNEAPAGMHFLRSKVGSASRASLRDPYPTHRDQDR